jgi:membrane fusion protein, multidrug efflux system
LLALLLAGCGEENTYVPPPPPSVTVSKPVQNTVTDTIELTGNTQLSNTVNLVARVGGYLQSVNFQDGSVVKKGDLLFVIEPEPYEANVQLAKATVEQQQATLTQATSEYERQQRLAKQNATSQSQVESWQAQREARRRRSTTPTPTSSSPRSTSATPGSWRRSTAASTSTWSTPATSWAPAG